MPLLCEQCSSPNDGWHGQAKRRHVLLAQAPRLNPSVAVGILGKQSLDHRLARKETFVSQRQRLTCIIQREDDGYVSFCPDFDVASQGDTVDEARTNLIEALELFFETASPSEVSRRG